MTDTAPATAPEAPARRFPPVGVVALLVVLVGVNYWIGRDLWFIDDDWDFLTQRTIGSLSSWLEPHAGHWTLPLTPLLRSLYGVFGLDYFPGWLFPRYAVAGLVAVLLWVVLVRRGADQWIATIAAATFVVLDAAAGHRAVSVGNYVVVAALLYVAPKVADDDAPTRRDLVLVALALVAAVTAFSTGTFLVGATGLVVLASRRLGRWWPALVPPVVLYGAWTVLYGPNRGGSGDGSVLEVPGAMLAVLANSQASLFGVPTWAGGVIAVAELAAIALLAWRRRLDRADAVALVMLAAFLGATALERVGSGTSADTDRYGFVPIVLLAFVLVPRIPAPRAAWTRAVAVVAGVALVAVNLAGTAERADELAEVAAERRILVETAATVLADGAPHVDDAWVTVPLTAEGLQVLVDDGWRPTAEPTGRQLRRARGVLWIGPGPDSKRDEAVTAGDPGCSAAAVGDVRRYEIDQPSMLVASAQAPTRLRIRTTIDGVVGERVITWGDGRGALRGETGAFQLAAPEGGTATVEVTPVAADDLVVCDPVPLD